MFAQQRNPFTCSDSDLTSHAQPETHYQIHYGSVLSTRGSDVEHHAYLEGRCLSESHPSPCVFL
jgi:hypothetical protein